MLLLQTPLKIFICILIADFTTGIVHWWEDAYGNPNWKYLGKSVVLPNLEHHQKPRAFLQGNFFERIKLSLFVASAICLLLYIFGCNNMFVFFTLLYMSLANEIHAISHRTDKENGKLICFIQKTGLLQTRKMHGLHHTSPYNVNYCVMTGFLNPVLNVIKFWYVIEWGFAKIGIKTIRCSEVRNGY